MKTALILLTFIIALGANLYGLLVGVSIVIPHLFYIPVILAAFFYPRRGVSFAIVLSAVYILMVAVLRPGINTEFISAVARCVVFVTIAAVLSYLSKRVMEREREIEAANKEWKRTFDAVPDLIALIGRDHHILRVNRAMSERLGIAPERAVGMHCFEVVHSLPSPPENCPHAKLLKDSRSHTEEIREDSLGGDFLVTTSPLTDTDGTLLGSVHIARDITERKRMEEALRESEERILLLLNSTAEAIYGLDLNGNCTFCNNACLRLLGYRHQDELLGKNMHWQIHCKHADGSRFPVEECRIFQAFQKGEGTHVDDEVLWRADGTPFPAEYWSYPQRHDGRVVGAVVTFLDITERKRTEEALRDSEIKYRTLVESSFDGIAIHQRGIIVYANRTAAEILGAEDPHVFVGRPALSIVDPAFRDRIAARVIQADENTLELVREKFLRLDGTPVDVDVATVPTVWEESPAAYVTFRDISAQIRAEEALRESEERYRTIIENIQDVFLRIDGANCIDMVSPSAAQTFGYTSVTEMLGLPVQTLWKNPDLRSPFLESLQKQNAVDWEAEFIKKDGTAFWVSISARMRRDESGHYAGSEEVIRDISGRKKMEDALKSALTKLNMLSSITRHDILNQITGLRTYLELSREDLKGTPFAEFIEKEDLAAEAIQRQIEFTKFYQDIGVNAPKWQEAGKVIREAIEQLSLSGIDIRMKIPTVEIFADPLIVKVFFNLMENSLRHGEHVTSMEFSSRESDAGFTLIYRDNGVGVSTEDRPKLFRKGFGKHTGLGLFLSREILAITGITIIENGVFGKGVLFEMTIPKGGYRFV